jgi:hypothetical protein
MAQLRCFAGPKNYQLIEQSGFSRVAPTSFSIDLDDAPTALCSIS